MEVVVSGRPRACGGGPSMSTVSSPVGSSSPRLRGWSPAEHPAGRHRRVVPAPAGVVPPGRGSRRTATGRPRACGGGPGRLDDPQNESVSSPRLRGWSRRLRATLAGPRVVPAPAGVVPPSDAVACPRGRRPRACGGGPSGSTSIVEGSWSSPRLRGWSPSRPSAAARKSVVPAPAGVVPSLSRMTRSTRGRPRACGGGPGAGVRAQLTLGSSPRLRGWSRSGVHAAAGRKVVPAPAGVVPRSRR